MRLAPPALLLTLALAACGPAYEVARPAPIAGPPTGAPAAARRSAAEAVADFRTAAPRIERAAEPMCRETHPGAAPRSCDFVFRLIDDPRIGPNAFQTMGEDGRPQVVMTLQLATLSQNSDEIAFVLGHEAGHHIADHISKGQSQAMTGALVMGTLATLGNASDQMVQDMMRIGASLGGRVYSQSYELEADTLGAYVAARAGYDPERGARIFARPDMAGGGGMLSSHPASGQRQATIAATSAEIRRQQARGQTPTPVPMRTSLLP